MNTVKFEVESPKEIYEVGVALGAIAKAVGQALLDGFQPTDIAVIITASIANLGNAIQGINQIGDEFKEMPAQASLGLVAPIIEGVSELIKLKK